MGRYKMSEPKDVTVQVRLTAKQYGELVELSSAAGVKPSAFLRGLLVEHSGLTVEDEPPAERPSQKPVGKKRGRKKSDGVQRVAKGDLHAATTPDGKTLDDIFNKVPRQDRNPRSR